MSLPPLLPIFNRTETCENDGFPLVEIGGETYCSVEYADNLVGGQKVIGVADNADGDGTIELLFADGWTMPLTCPCCGGALHLKPRSLQEVRALLIGRTLEGFRHGEWVGQGAPPQRHPVFALQFSGAEERDDRTIEVSLESVRRLREGNKP